MKPAEFLAAQQERGDRLAAVAERIGEAARTFLDDHANPAPGEACFAAHGTTDLTVALAELPGVLQEWRSRIGLPFSADSLQVVDSATRTQAVTASDTETIWAPGTDPRRPDRGPLA